jgi:hypothetical protein
MTDIIPATPATPEATPSLPVPAAPTRMEQIKELMGDSRSAYWSGPASERLQNEYRQMVSRDRPFSAGGDDSDDAAPAARGSSPATDSRALDQSVALANLASLGTLGTQLADELGNRTHAMRYGEGQRQRIVAAIGPTAPDVIDSFSGLSNATQAAVYAELATVTVPHHHASHADCQTFTQTQHGAILATEVGADLPARLGRILHRWSRIADRLSESQLAELSDFFSHRLQARERAAVLREWSK